MAKILVVDDEQVLVKGIKFNLEHEGYQVEAGYDGEQAVELAREGGFDLIILDLMMPKIDGYDLLEYIRPTGTPSIFVTAKDAVSERVRGLHSGADDYIVKPFAPAELTARVEAVLRRTGRATVQYSLWGFTVDTAACRVTRAGQEIKLTRKEYELLLLLLRVYPKKELQDSTPTQLNEKLDALWDDVLALQNDDPVTVSGKPAEPAPQQNGLLSRLLPGIRPAGPNHLKVAFVHERTPEISAWTSQHEFGRTQLDAVFPG